MRNCLMPGKVENWLSIMNLEGLRIIDIDRKLLQASSSALINVYRCRNRRMYVLNTSYGMKIMYMFVKTFLNEATTRKFVLTDQPTCQAL